MRVPLTVLRDAAGVLAATGDDPFARATLPRTQQPHGWAAAGAVAWLGDRHAGASYLSAVGDPAAVGALLAQVLGQVPDHTRLTVPCGTPLPAGVRLHGTRWDLRWLTAEPQVQPGEDLVSELRDEASVAALLQTAAPTASARPGEADVHGWFGVAGDGQLLACAADTSRSPDVGHLSAIAVRQDQRGRGLGSAVTAALTRRLVTGGATLVTLGVYADNAAGRALYDRLGFADTHHFTSGPFTLH